MRSLSADDYDKIRNYATEFSNLFYRAAIQTCADSYNIKITLLGLYLTTLNADNQNINGYGLFLTTIDLVVLSIYSPITAMNAEIASHYSAYIENPTHENHIKLASCFAAMIGYATFIGIPLGMCTLFFSQSWLTCVGKLFGYHDFTSIHVASSILKPLSLVFPFVMIGGIFRCAIRSAKLDYIFTPGIVILLAALLLAKGFSSGNFGLPDFGLSGVLFFFIAEAVVAFSYYLFNFLKIDKLEPFRSRVGFDAILNHDQYAYLCCDFFKFSGLTFIESFSNYLYFFMVTLSSHHYGLAAQTAFSMALQLFRWCDLFSNANAIVSGISFSGALARKNSEEIHRLSYTSLLSALSIPTVLGGICMIVPSALPTLLNNKDVDVTEKLKSIIYLIFLTVLFNTVGSVRTYKIRVMKDFLSPAVCRLIAVGIGLVTSYFMGSLYGLPGMISGCLLALEVRYISLELTFQKHKRHLFFPAADLQTQSMGVAIAIPAQNPALVSTR